MKMEMMQPFELSLITQIHAGGNHKNNSIFYKC